MALWFWCLRHRQPEPEGEQCGAVDRLGPYASREDALRWKDRVEARNRQWDDEDERWEDEGSGQRS